MPVVNLYGYNAEEVYGIRIQLAMALHAQYPDTSEAQMDDLRSEIAINPIESAPVGLDGRKMPYALVQGSSPTLAILDGHHGLEEGARACWGPLVIAEILVRLDMDVELDLPCYPVRPSIRLGTYQPCTWRLFRDKGCTFTDIHLPGVPEFTPATLP